MTTQQSYREATVRGASPVELIIRLYEQTIEDLRQAAIALDQNDIGRRSDRIKHALLILGHLQNSLDFTRGGKVAENLNNFYTYLRRNLLSVQFHPSKSGIMQQITDVLAVREAWIEVERKERMPDATPGDPASALGAGKDSASARVDWSV
jgi:flagellar protein FliS